MRRSRRLVFALLGTLVLFALAAALAGAADGPAVPAARERFATEGAPGANRLSLPVTATIAETEAAVAKLTGASLSGVAERKPKLRFTLAARPGAKLTTVTVTTPPGLVASSSPQALAKGVVVRSAGGAELATKLSITAQTIRVRLVKPQPTASFKLSRPALSVSPKLLEHVESGITRKLGLIVTARETGGVGSRFPIVVPLS